MAKKKAEEEKTNPDEFIDRIYQSVEKDFGDNILIDGERAMLSKPQVIPWSPALDIINSGGIEEGSCVGISGHPKLGKTVASLCLAANAQKPEHGERPVFYFKVEGRLSLTHLKGIKGLNLKKGRFNIIQSTEGTILSAQQFLSIMENVIKTVPGAFVIIDSISALCDEKEQNDGVGTETRGGGAKLFSQFCRLINQVVPVNRTIVVGIAHLISNTSGMGPQYHERAARMWGYQKDYDLRANMKTPWKAGENIIGLDVKWTCMTSKNGPPGMSIQSYIRFGVGIDGLYEIMNLGMQAGLIKQAGSWLTLSCLEKPEYKDMLDGKLAPKFQGAEKVYAALSDNPKWAKVLEKEVGSMVGGGSVGGEE